MVEGCKWGGGGGCRYVPEMEHYFFHAKMIVLYNCIVFHTYQTINSVNPHQLKFREYIWVSSSVHASHVTYTDRYVI